MGTTPEDKRELLDKLEDMLRRDGRAPKLQRWAGGNILTAGPYIDNAGRECFADIGEFNYDEQQRTVPAYLEIMYRGPFKGRGGWEEYDRVTGLDADSAATGILSDMQDIT